MRISDWSSDVCSSDLEDVEHIVRTVQAEANAFATSIAAGADAISDARDISPVSEIVAVAREMVARTRVVEARLDDAPREAQVLRRELDEARADAQRDPLTQLPHRRVPEERSAIPTVAPAAIRLAMRSGKPTFDAQSLMIHA